MPGCCSWPWRLIRIRCYPTPGLCPLPIEGLPTSKQRLQVDPQVPVRERCVVAAGADIRHQVSLQIPQTWPSTRGHRTLLSSYRSTCRADPASASACAFTTTHRSLVKDQGDSQDDAGGPIAPTSYRAPPLEPPRASGRVRPCVRRAWFVSLCVLRWVYC